MYTIIELKSGYYNTWYYINFRFVFFRKEFQTDYYHLQSDVNPSPDIQ